MSALTITMFDVIESFTAGWATLQFVARCLLVLWALSGVGFALYAPAGAYVSEGKWNKWGWVAVCAASALAMWVQPYGMLGVIAMVAVGVFFADVRPVVARGRQ